MSKAKMITLSSLVLSALVTTGCRTVAPESYTADARKGTIKAPTGVPEIFPAAVMYTSKNMVVSGNVGTFTKVNRAEVTVSNRLGETTPKYIDVTIKEKHKQKGVTIKGIVDESKTKQNKGAVEYHAFATQDGVSYEIVLLEYTQEVATVFHEYTVIVDLKTIKSKIQSSIHLQGNPEKVAEPTVTAD